MSMDRLIENFLDLNDVPHAYAAAGRAAVVNAGTNGLVFSAVLSEHFLRDVTPNGMMEAIVVSDEVGLNVKWSAGEIWVDSNLFATDERTVNLALTDNSTNYIYATVAGGATLVVSTVAPAGEYALVARIYTYNGDIEYILHEPTISKNVEALHISLGDLHKEMVEDGMFCQEDTDATNANDFLVGTGSYYLHAHDKISIGSILYSAGVGHAANDLRRYFHTGGVWGTEMSNGVDFANWDNGTNKVGTAAGKWYVAWIVVEGAGTLEYVYPQTEHTSEAKALNEPLVYPPLHQGYVIPVAKFVFRHNAAAFNGSTAYLEDIRPFHGTGQGNGVVQNLWYQVVSDAGNTTADDSLDVLTIAGGAGISTAIAGDTLTITNDDLGSGAVATHEGTYNHGNYDTAVAIIAAGAGDWDTAAGLVAAGAGDWDIAHGWGDHAGAGYADAAHNMASHTDDDTYNILTSGTLGAGAAAVTSLDAGSGTITTSGYITTTGGGHTGKFQTGAAGKTVLAYSQVDGDDGFAIRHGAGGSASQNVFSVDASENFDFYGGNVTRIGTLDCGVFTVTLPNAPTFTVTELDLTGSDAGDLGYAPLLTGTPTTFLSGVGIKDAIVLFGNTGTDIDPRIVFATDTFDHFKALCYDLTADTFVFEDALKIEGRLGVGANTLNYNWDAIWDVVDVGGTSAFGATAATGVNGIIMFAQNAYYDDANNRWEYKETDEASSYQQAHGEHLFFNAASGTADDPITWVTAMRIDVTGRVGMGVVPSYRCHIQGTADVTFPLYVKSTRTTGVINAAHFFSDGNNVEARGIEIRAGEYAESGTNFWLVAKDGSGTITGGLYSVEGIFADYNASDKRLKQNIKDTVISGRDKILGLKVKDFEYIKNPGHVLTDFVAQEMLDVCPEAVGDPDPESGMYSIAKGILIPTIVKHNQEMQGEIDLGVTGRATMQGTIEALEAEVNRLRDMVEGN